MKSSFLSCPVARSCFPVLSLFILFDFFYTSASSCSSGCSYLSVCSIDLRISIPLFFPYSIHSACFFISTSILPLLQLSLSLCSLHPSVLPFSCYPSISLSTSTRSEKVGNAERISRVSRVGCQTPLRASSFAARARS